MLSPQIEIVLFFEHLGQMTELAVLLGQNIRKVRQEKKISQEKLALMCGLDRSYMGRIERGEVNITLEKLYLIASILKIDVKKLLP
jgi:transcriptional regulator with XRE-family HTH domain